MFLNNVYVDIHEEYVERIGHVEHIGHVSETSVSE